MILKKTAYAVKVKRKRPPLTCSREALHTKHDCLAKQTV